MSDHTPGPRERILLEAVTAAQPETLWTCGEVSLLRFGDGYEIRRPGGWVILSAQC